MYGRGDPSLESTVHTHAAEDKDAHRNDGPCFWSLEWGGTIRPTIEYLLFSVFNEHVLLL